MAKQPRKPATADQTSAPVETSSGVSTTPSTRKPRKVEKTDDGLTIEHF
jgi:hypothetical protein